MIMNTLYFKIMLINWFPEGTPKACNAFKAKKIYFDVVIAAL